MPSEGQLPKEEARWQVGELPFVFRHCAVPSNAEYGVPDRLSFSLEVDPETGRICQAFSRVTADVMDKAYQHGSVLSGAMDDHGIGRSYAQDFLAYITTVLPSLAGMRILEIGCGTGYLLSLLRDQGGEVVGIEPGPQGESAHDRFGVPVVRDFFPSSQLPENYDLVIAYGVLEHLPNPAVLLRHIQKQLAPQGTVILAVPNCEPYVKSGDISCLFPEHWSYFTGPTLRATLQRNGFAAEVIPAGFGGSLYCAARLAVGGEPFSPSGDSSQELETYRTSAERVLRHLGDLLGNARQNGQEVGIYAAGRLLNALTLLHMPRAAMPGIRFFDDNDLLHGKYFPGWPIPIENRADYARRPPNLTLVASRSFGSEIIGRLTELQVGGRVLGWNDLYPA